jgi:flavin-dependent dehydrogenase
VSPTSGQYEVLIFGAGPAGCATALALTPARSVILVDRQPGVVPRIGESLHPAAHRLLAELGLLAAMNEQGHATCHANRAVWGGDRPVDSDFMRHPDGLGWHLDRAHFDQWLRDSAVARGASLRVGLAIDGIARDGERWRVELSDGTSRHVIAADILVDASGRRSALAGALGVRRTSDPQDRLACGWVHLGFTGSHGAGITIVEATADGWWYTAPLPGGARVLALHTDRDLPAARVAARLSGLPRQACATTQEVAAAIAPCFDSAIVASGYTTANGSFLQCPVGEGWLAVGDAAIATDPIAARGLLHALYTGIAAARAIGRRLSGEVDAFQAYAAVVANLVEQYRHGQRHCYSQEQRFPNSEFWRRRQAPSAITQPTVLATKLHRPPLGG